MFFASYHMHNNGSFKAAIFAWKREEYKTNSQSQTQSPFIKFLCKIIAQYNLHIKQNQSNMDVLLE